MHELIKSLRNCNSSISNSGEARNWHNIEDRCRTHPHEADHLDRRGRTCLHAACAKKPPVTAVECLLRACGKRGETILERDKHGRTPLLIGIASNACLPVISLLLQSAPKAAAVHDHLGQLPLHLACAFYDPGQIELVRLLLVAFPDAARRESFDGRLPLHAAVESNAPQQVVEQLVQGKYGSHCLLLCYEWFKNHI